MPIIKSAKKRVKLAAKAGVRNSKTKRAMREAIKSFSSAVESGKSADILKSQTEASSALDTAVKKHVIHRNKASRKKAWMAKTAKEAGVKIAKSAKTKAPAKKKSPAKS